MRGFRIKAYFAVVDGKTLVDEDSMREEFESKLNKLKERIKCTEEPLK